MLQTTNKTCAKKTQKYVNNPQKPAKANNLQFRCFFHEHNSTFVLVSSPTEAFNAQYAQYQWGQAKGSHTFDLVAKK
jgi:hypothetical protein